MSASWVVLTRPQGQNGPLATLLGACGHRSLELPGLHIQPLAFDPPDLDRFDVLMFVSGNAVRSFLAHCASLPGWTWPAGVPAAVVGEGSAQALRTHPAFPATADILRPPASSTADSEALWAVLRGRPDLQRILIVRGGGAGEGRGRDWLGRQLEGAGRTVVRLGVYDRSPYLWSEDDLLRLRACLAEAGALAWLFSSRESVDAIFAQLKQNGLESCLRSSHLVVTHPRIRDHLVDLILDEPVRRPGAGPALESQTRQGHVEGARAASLLLHVCKPDDRSIVDAIESLL